MSTAISTSGPGQPHSSGQDADLDGRVTPTPVVVRRNAALAALVGAAASAIAIAYLWRATQSGSALDWVLCLVLAALAAVYLSNLVDARTPLLVADELGVRIRLGNQWRGLPWDAVGSVVVQPRSGLAKDGRLMFVPDSLGRALGGLDGRGRRAAALNQRLYGAALAVPLGLSTRVSVDADLLSEELAALSHSRTEIVVVHSAPEPEESAAPGAEPSGSAAAGAEASAAAGPFSAATAQASVPAQAFAPPAESTEIDGGPPSGDPVEENDTDDVRAGRGSLLHRLGTRVSRPGQGRRGDPEVESAPDDRSADDPEPTAVATTDLEGDRTPVDDGAAPAEADEPRPLAARSVLPLRDTRHAARAQITRDQPATVLGSAALLPEPVTRSRAAALPESRELRRPNGPGADLDAGLDADWAADDRVRPLASLGDPVPALVIDDFVVEPAYDPVIGPELAAARTRVGLSVDELAERTRIRPHVIESIEVDDFAPCGGDFYARGHLRTLARVLGRDPGPLLDQFDRRYATAPINARRVFEAELATGMTASVRNRAGGPNWALLVGVVLALVLTWGVVRLFSSEQPELLSPVAPSLSGSAGVDRGAQWGSPGVAAPAKPIRLTLQGAEDGSRVVVRDRLQKIVWAGELSPGQRRAVQAGPPVSVQADDAGAVRAAVNGVDQGVVGRVGDPATRVFRRPAAR